MEGKASYDLGDFRWMTSRNGQDYAKVKQKAEDREIGEL